MSAAAMPRSLNPDASCATRVRADTSNVSATSSASAKRHEPSSASRSRVSALLPTPDALVNRSTTHSEAP